MVLRSAEAHQGGPEGHVDRRVGPLFFHIIQTISQLSVLQIKGSLGEERGNKMQKSNCTVPYTTTRGVVFIGNMIRSIYHTHLGKIHFVEKLPIWLYRIPLIWNLKI